MPYTEDKKETVNDEPVSNPVDRNTAGSENMKYDLASLYSNQVRDNMDGSYTFYLEAKPAQHTDPPKDIQKADASGIWIKDGVAYQVLTSLMEPLTAEQANSQRKKILVDITKQLVSAHKEEKAAFAPTENPDIFNHPALKGFNGEIIKTKPTKIKESFWKALNNK